MEGEPALVIKNLDDELNTHFKISNLDTSAFNYFYDKFNPLVIRSNNYDSSFKLKGDCFLENIKNGENVIGFLNREGFEKYEVSENDPAILSLHPVNKHNRVGKGYYFIRRSEETSEVEMFGFQKMQKVFNNNPELKVHKINVNHLFYAEGLIHLAGTLAVHTGVYIEYDGTNMKIKTYNAINKIKHSINLSGCSEKLLYALTDGRSGSPK